MTCGASNARRARAHGWLVALVLIACADARRGAEENGQTHWLRECTSDRHCGALRCLCGLCSTSCDEEGACPASLGPDAVCRSAARVQSAEQCAGEDAAEQRICVPECDADDDCDALAPGLTCSAGVCISTSAPDAAVNDAAANDAAPPMDSGTIMTLPMDSGTVITPPVEAGPIVDQGEVTCQDGDPTQLPPDVELLASDIYEHLWSVSGGIVTWIATTSTSWTLGRKPVTGGAESFADGELGTTFQALASDGADAFGRYSNIGGETQTYVRLMPESGNALNLAIEPGMSFGSLAVDADAVYWISTPAFPGTSLRLVRTPRAPGESTPLGGRELDGEVAGPVLVGDSAYLALSTMRTGQVYRAPIDANGELLPFGPVVGPVSTFVADGADLLLMLKPQLDNLDNPIAPARIARMTPDAGVSAIAEVHGVQGSLAREPISLALAAGNVYWIVIDEKPNDDVHNAVLWAAPADGSAAPVPVMTVTGHLLANVIVGQSDGVYVELMCLTDTTPGLYEMRTHILRIAL